MTRRFACGVATLAFLATACGAGAPGTPADPDGATPAALASESPGGEAFTPSASSSPTGPAGMATTDPSEDPGGPSPSPSPSPDLTPLPRSERHNNEVLTITLSAECVRQGDVLVVTLHGPPRAGLSMIIAYSDYQAHTATGTGESDGNGRFIWPVTVAPTVPPGPARVLATSTGPDWSQEGGGSADQPFRVAGLEGC